jgi:YYY domain-containing protein
VTANIVAWARQLRLQASTKPGKLLERSDQTAASLRKAMPYGALSFVMALILGNLAATQQWWENHGEGAHFNWWTPTRVIPDTINEFPAFSFLLSCFHAHVLTLTYTVMAIGLAFNFLLEREGKGLQVFGRGWRLACTVVTSGLVSGALFTMNGWDYPTYTGLVVLCLALQQWLAHDMRISWEFARNSTAAITAPVALSLLLYLPFYLNIVSPVQGLGLVPIDNRSKISDEMLIYGLSGFIFLTLLLASAARSPLSGFLQNRAGSRTLRITLIALLLMDLCVVFLVPNSTTLLVISNITIFAILLALHHMDDRSHAFVLILGGLAFALVAGCEIFYMRDTFDGGEYQRMNTVFKYYFQAWAMLSIASSAGLFFIFDSFRPREMASLMRRWSLRASQGVWSAGLGALLLAAAVYPVLAPVERANIYNADTHTWLAPPSSSLDGLSYLAGYTSNTCHCSLAGDYQAIRWLNANVQGDPVIVEAMGGDYSIYGRVSAFTGLPDPINWYGHEQQWRANWLKRDGNYEDYQRRGFDIDVIYTNPDPSKVLALMTRYHVQYLYVGAVELAKYPQADLQRFSAFMQVVYSADGVTIYKVR